jgi:hypothetical protein
MPQESRGSNPELRLVLRFKDVNNRRDIRSKHLRISDRVDKVSRQTRE